MKSNRKYIFDFIPNPLRKTRSTFWFSPWTEIRKIRKFSSILRNGLSLSLFWSINDVFLQIIWLIRHTWVEKSITRLLLWVTENASHFRICSINFYCKIDLKKWKTHQITETYLEAKYSLRKRSWWIRRTRVQSLEWKITPSHDPIALFSLWFHLIPLCVSAHWNQECRVNQN